MAVEIRAATYAALRTALAAGTYKKGQSVWCEAANAESYGFGTGWFQVRDSSGLTDDSLSTFVGGSYAAIRHTGEAWAAYTSAISFLDAPGKNPAFSHTRATVGALCQQFDGSFYQPEIGEIGSHGMRRVRNLLASTDTFATQGVTVEAADYWLSFTGTGSVAVSGVATNSLAGTGVSNRVSKKITAGAAGTMTLTVTGSVTNAMLTKSRAGQLIADPEYVSRGVLSAPYHGWGIDGVRCFATGPNGEDLTDAASGYPVRAAGAVRNPAITNLCPQSETFDTWTNTVTGTAITPVKSGDLVTLNGGGGSLLGDFSGVSISVPGLTASATYTISVWVKAESAADVGKVLAFRGVGGAGYSLVTLASNWVRASSAEVAISTSAAVQIALRGTTGSSMGEVSFRAKVQVNAGADALPYVPTTTASVALAADASSLDPTAWGYDQDGGVWVIVHTPALSIDASANAQALLDVSTDGSNFYLVYNQSGNLGVYVYKSGSAQWSANSATGDWVAGTRQVVVARIETDNGNLAVAGASLLSDSSMNVPAASVIDIGGDSGAKYAGAIEALYYFPPGTITDAQLLTMSNGDLPTTPELA